MIYRGSKILSIFLLTMLVASLSVSISQYNSYENNLTDMKSDNKTYYMERLDTLNDNSNNKINQKELPITPNIELIPLIWMNYRIMTYHLQLDHLQLNSSLKYIIINQIST